MSGCTQTDLRASSDQDECFPEQVSHTDRHREILHMMSSSDATECLNAVSMLSLCEPESRVRDSSTSHLSARGGPDTPEDLNKVDTQTRAAAHVPSEGSDIPEEPEKTPSPQSKLVIPPDFCCPISMDIMRDPVLVATGQTYDRICIERWLRAGRRTCPKTGVRLRHTELTPNIALRSIIHDWAQQNSVNIEPQPPTDSCPAATNDDNAPVGPAEQDHNISLGHDEIVWAIHKHGGRFYTASADRTVRVWNAREGRCIDILEGHSRPVLALASTETYLFSGSYDHTVRVWDMFSLTCVQTLIGHTDAVRAVKVVGGRLFSGSYDGTVRAWDASTLQLQETLCGHQGPVRTLEAAGSCVFSGSYDSTVCAWNLDTLTLDARLQGHTASVRALAATNSLVFSGSDDSTICVWHAHSLTPVATLSGHLDNVRVLAASPHHPHLLFSGSWDKTVRIWDTRTLSCVHVMRGHTEAVLALAVGRTKLASGGYDAAVMFWDLEAMECVRVARGHEDAVRVIETDGENFVSGAYDGSVGVWRS